MQRRFVLSAAFAALVLGGCSDSTGPTREEVTGLYVSRVFTTTVDHSTTDQVEKGGYVRVMLLNDELLALETVVPAHAITEDGENVQTLGTWDIHDAHVRLQPDSSSVMSRIRFRQVDSTLVGDASINGVAVHIVLNPEPLK